MKSHDIQVSTYSGYKADERPLKFTFEGKTHTIKEIIRHAYEEIPGKGLRRVYDTKTDEGLIGINPTPTYTQLPSFLE